MCTQAPSRQHSGHQQPSYKPNARGSDTSFTFSYKYDMEKTDYGWQITQ